ncbi:MAG: hypothetical protein WA979_05495 [Pacificimonas sp.]
MIRYAPLLWLACPALAQDIPPDSDLSDMRARSAFRAACQPIGEDGTINICARLEPERSKYRLADREGVFDPKGPLDSVSRERLRHMELGREGVGIGTCDGIGAGADIGCNAARHRRIESQNPGGILSF